MYLIDRLDNGIRVVIEKIPYINSVSIGVIVECGSKDENDKNNGIAHFVEHMLFKGTVKRTAKEIAETIDNIGGILNAFTTKETTVYYANVLSNHIEIAMDVLSDMLLNSIFKDEDIEKEKSVVLEELYMYHDSPEDLVVDLIHEMMFKGTSLAYNVLGTKKNIKAINRNEILNFYKKNYVPEKMVISIVGNIDEKECLKMLKFYFGQLAKNNTNYTSKIESNNNYEFTSKIKHLYKDTEQINLCIGMEGLPITSSKFEALMLLNNIFGGSMSSRLFQKVREDLGLAYSIDTFPTAYKEVGILNLLLSLHPKQIIKSLKAILDEIINLRENLITKEELEKAKDQLKGSYILDMENTFNRMLEIGKTMIIFNKIFTQKEILSKIDSISIEDIYEVSRIIFNRKKFNIAYVGKVKNVNENKIKEIIFEEGK
ncbi:MAG TPA: pitrilysin family protein [Tissierellaceae bacterium]